MRFSFDPITVALLCLTATPSLAHPAAGDVEVRDAAELHQRDNGFFADVRDLWKRKGGGGGGGRGGSSGSSSSGSSSSGSSSSSSGSSSSSSGSRGGSSSSSSGSSSGSSGSRSYTGGASSSSNAGGKTKQGSGVTPGYGGGKYYGGGATTPYTAGRTSPAGLLAVPLIGGALLVYPGLWLYGAYAYPYHHPYSYYNRTARRNRTATSTSSAPTATATAPGRRSIVDTFFEIEARQNEETGANETKPVTCLCAEYAVCGCDDNSDTTFLDDIIGDGDWATLNKTLVQVADINGTSTIILNGTLPNGTTVAGSDSDPDAFTESSSSGTSSGTLVQASGYWVMIAMVGFTCFLV